MHLTVFFRGAVKDVCDVLIMEALGSTDEIKLTNQEAQIVSELDR